MNSESVHGKTGFSQSPHPTMRQPPCAALKETACATVCFFKLMRRARGSDLARKSKQNRCQERLRQLLTGPPP